jgi:hypothetical protein
MTDHDHEHCSGHDPSELAKLLVERVQHSLKIALDGTPDTLPILDHYLEQKAAKDRAFQSELAKSDKGVVVGVVPETLAIELGAYLGQVAIQSLPGGGRWHWDAHAPEHTRIEFGHIGLCFNPVALAFEVLDLPPLLRMDAAMVLLPDDREMIHESLDALGQVDEADFHRLTIRFEVLSHVADTLLAKEALLREKAAAKKGKREEDAPEAPIVERYDSAFYDKLLLHRPGMPS